MEETFEELLTLVREGHEAVINEEEVEKYHAKLKAFIRSVAESARTEQKKKCKYQEGDLEYLIKCAVQDERKELVKWAEENARDLSVEESGVIFKDCIPLSFLLSHLQENKIK